MKLVQRQTPKVKASPKSETSPRIRSYQHLKVSQRPNNLLQDTRVEELLSKVSRATGLDEQSLRLKHGNRQLNRGRTLRHYDLGEACVLRLGADQLVKCTVLRRNSFLPLTMSRNATVLSLREKFHRNDNADKATTDFDQLRIAKGDRLLDDGRELVQLGLSKDDVLQVVGPNHFTLRVRAGNKTFGLFAEPSLLTGTLKLLVHHLGGPRPYDQILTLRDRVLSDRDRLVDYAVTSTTCLEVIGQNQSVVQVAVRPKYDFVVRLRPGLTAQQAATKAQRLAGRETAEANLDEDQLPRLVWLPPPDSSGASPVLLEPDTQLDSLDLGPGGDGGSLRRLHLLPPPASGSADVFVFVRDPNGAARLHSGCPATLRLDEFRDRLAAQLASSGGGGGGFQLRPVVPAAAEATEATATMLASSLASLADSRGFVVLQMQPRIRR